MHWLSWLRSPNSSVPKYQPLSLPESALDKDTFKWKRRFSALFIVYIATILCGIASILFKLERVTIKPRLLPTDAIFGDSESDHGI